LNVVDAPAAQSVPATIRLLATILERAKAPEVEQRGEEPAHGWRVRIVVTKRHGKHVPSLQPAGLTKRVQTSVDTCRSVACSQTEVLLRPDDRQAADVRNLPEKGTLRRWPVLLAAITAVASARPEIGSRFSRGD
jgi:hypothetical protein